MKIFLSWSGERSKLAALALREWLPLVLHYVQPWFSDRDVEAGERWAVEIGRELEGTNFGIVVLTPDNLNAPWILFETGALSKAFTAGAVMPYLIDLEFKDISGPLSQFQAKKAEKTSTLDLINAINSRAPNPIESARLVDLFDALWPKLEVKLRNLPATKAEAKPRAQGQVLEDLVAAVRRLEARLDRAVPMTTDEQTRFVTVHVEGQFPLLDPDDISFGFSPGMDPVRQISEIVGAPLEQFGKEWHIVTEETERPLSRVGLRFLVRKSRSRSLSILLRKGAIPPQKAG
ncbi:MAG: TIR domain-containing protein [Thermoanaerobaculia bacterium]